MRNFYLSLVVLCASVSTALSQVPAELETMYLGNDNHVTLNIPARLADRMVTSATHRPDVSVAVEESVNDAGTTPDKPVSSVATGAKTGGYRVQVYLDNNARTAKNEARARARNISERFPNYPTYVVYSSPYWRLRVGNFRSHEEADEAAAEISAAFPSYAREVRVVRDRIVVTSD